MQATIEDGWYENATRLSAPYEMNSHSYTVTDELLSRLNPFRAAGEGR